MTIRRLNFTQRRRIVRSDVDIVLRKNTGETTFDAALKLSGYQFPPDAKVFIEAYQRTSVMRFDFGTVSVPNPTPNRSLTEFSAPPEVLFRVRVTATSARAGMLLGEADQLRPTQTAEAPDRRIALLPVVPDDLGEEVWSVDFSGQSGASLLVNRRLADWKETTRSPWFRALVFPAAMRQILVQILKVDRFSTSDDSGDWRARWLRFAAQLPGSRPVPQATEDQDDWIGDATAAFARNNRMLTNGTAGEER